jgi:hypothetical protein
MRELLRALLEAHPEALKHTGSFEAVIRFQRADLALSRHGDRLTISGPDQNAQALSIRYCLDRNWLPLTHCLAGDESQCDEDDLWEQSDLAYVLAADRDWAAWLRSQLPARVEVISGD